MVSGGSDSTALMIIRIETRTGRPTRTNPSAAAGAEGLRPITRPAMRKTNTGTAMVPNAPSGSRRKIFTSSQVSVQSPRMLMSPHARSRRH